MAESSVETILRNPMLPDSLDGTQGSVSPTDLYYMASAIRTDTTPSGNASHYGSEHCNTSFSVDVATPLRAARRLSFTAHCAKTSFMVDSPERRQAHKPPLLPRSKSASPEVQITTGAVEAGFAAESSQQHQGIEQRQQRVGEEKMAEASEQLAECYRALEDERNRHAAVEEFWRKTGEEAISDVHAADLELIKREVRLIEREEQLQKLKTDLEKLQTKLADDREDFDEEKRDQALRRSRIAERELQLQDREAELESELQRQAEGRESELQGRVADKEAEMQRRLEEREDDLQRRVEELQQLQARLAVRSVADAYVGTDELPCQRARHKLFGAVLGGFVAAALILVTAVAMTCTGAIAGLIKEAESSHELVKQQQQRLDFPLTSVANFDVASERLTFDTLHTSRWLPADTLWFEKSHPVLQAIIGDVCPSDMLKTQLEATLRAERLAPCAEARPTSNQTALAPYSSLPANRQSSIMWRHLKVPAGVLVGLIGYFQLM